MTQSNDLSKYWAPVYNYFDPFRPVPPDKLDAWFVRRPDSPLSVLLTHFRPEHLPERLIMFGHRSSGKSSELARLTKELAAEDFGYFVIHLDLSRNLNINRVNVIETLFLIGAAVYKVVKDANLKPDEGRFRALVNSLNTIAQKHTENKNFEVNWASLLKGLVCFGAGLLAGPAGAPVVIGAADALQDFNFISGTSTEIVRKVEVEPQISEMLGRVNEVIDDAQAKARRNVVLIVDGLDRVQNDDMIELLFIHNRSLAEINCRVLYTAPMSVKYQPQFAPIRQSLQTVPFPNIRLHHRHSQKPDEAGFEAMQAIVSSRLASAGRDHGYDYTDAISPKALESLVLASGGLVRDLIRLMRDACVQAELDGSRRIEPETAQNVVAALRREYEAQLTPRYRDVLAEVRKTQQRVEGPECDLMLAGNFVLSYSNKDIWYDVHSILW